MKITLFTSNKSRHNYLINLLSNISDELFVLQECDTIFPGEIPGHYPSTPTIRKYFNEVNNAQKIFFGNSYINILKKNINILPMLFGDLNKCSLDILSKFLESDIYIVFGCSYIKGELIEFLVNHKALNIHIGISPYYRGTDCNFWALYDDNPHLVGATIHFLTKGLDNGPILYHAVSNIKSNHFEYTMSTVKAAFHSLAERIKDGSIFKINPLDQNKTNEIRYSKKTEFTDDIVRKYFEKNIEMDTIDFDASLLKDPFYFDN